MEGNAIITAMTTGSTAIASGFVSLVGDLIASPAVAGLIGLGLGYGLLKFVMNRLPGVR